MNLRQCVLDALHHRRPERVPFTVPCDPEVEERLDQHYGGRQWRERLPAFVTMVGAVATDHKEKIDEVRVRDPYGGIWRIDQRPWHLETPPLASPSFDGYDFPKPEVFFRPEWKAAARATCAAQGKQSFVVASLGWGLFERSWNLRGFENILMDAVAEPEFFAEALDRLMNLYLAFVDYTADLPVAAILFGDEWGDQRGIIVGPPRWRQFLKPRWARIYQRVHEHGKLVMHHSCGSVADIMPDLIEIGMDVLESCQPEAAGMSPYDLHRKWGDRMGFWGMIGSQRLLPFGTPAEIAAEVRRLRREVAAGGGVLLAPAKPLQPETPTANAVALIETLLETE